MLGFIGVELGSVLGLAVGEKVEIFPVCCELPIGFVDGRALGWIEVSVAESKGFLLSVRIVSCQTFIPAAVTPYAVIISPHPSDLNAMSMLLNHST